MRIDFRTRKRRRRKATATIGSGRAPRPAVRRSTGASSRTLPGSRGGRLAPEAEYIGRRRNVVGRGQGSTIFPRRSRPATLVRRAVLAVLMLAALALLTVSYRDTRAVSGLQMAAVEVVQPIERGLTRAWQPVQDAADWVVHLFSATSENPRLEERVEELEARISATRTVEEENERLRDLLAIDERGRFPGGYRREVGTVISRSNAIDRSFLIDLGSNDGVSRDDPVMVARGLVGRVEAVSPNAARVGLIVNRQQAVSAVVEGSSAVGVLRALGNDGSPVLRLSYVSRRAEIHKGDRVVTSGWTTGDLSSIYPKGIPIGVVSSHGSSPADLYQTVQVTPFADFDRIDEVIVLVPRAKPEKIVEPPTPDARQILGSTSDAPQKARPATPRRRAARTEQPEQPAR